MTTFQVNDRLLHRGAIYCVTGPVRTVETMSGEHHEMVPVKPASGDAQKSICGLYAEPAMSEQRWPVESTDGKWWRQMPDEYELADRAKAQRERI